MKQNIHPNWHDDCVVTCACGNTFVTGSSQEKIEVEICSACHPFFTGEMRFVDTQGRVDRFMQKMQAAQQTQTKSKKKSKKSGETKSYRQLLQEQKETMKSARLSVTQLAQQKAKLATPQTAAPSPAV